MYSLWTDCVSLWGSRRNKTIMSMTTQMCQMRHTEPFIVKRILRFWPVFLFVGRSFNLETKLVDLHPDDQPPKGQWLFKSIQIGEYNSLKNVFPFLKKRNICTTRNSYRESFKINLGVALRFIVLEKHSTFIFQVKVIEFFRILDLNFHRVSF